MKNRIKAHLRTEIEDDYREFIRRHYRVEYWRFLEEAYATAVWRQYCLVVALVGVCIFCAVSLI